VWVIPIAVFVTAVAGLWSAFRRWRNAANGQATAEDVALVEKLLSEDPRDEDNV
jgi:cytochrome c-type biogenesis protein CcmH/NrfF